MDRKKIFIVIGFAIIFVGVLSNIGLEGTKDKKSNETSTNISSPSTKNKNNYLDLDYNKYYFIDLHSSYIPNEGIYKKNLALKEQGEIKSAIQFFNELEVVLLDKTYQFRGSDVPLAWGSLNYDKSNKADTIRFFEDFDHSIIIRLHVDSERKAYKIDIAEYKKLKKIFEMYEVNKDTK